MSHEAPATADAPASANAQANMSPKPAERVVGEELDQRASAPISSAAADATHTVPTLPNLAASDGAVGEELDARSSAANGAPDVQATAAEAGLLSRGAGDASQPSLHVMGEEADAQRKASFVPTKDQLAADHRSATGTAAVGDSDAGNTARLVGEELDGRAHEASPASPNADAQSAKAPRYAAVKPSSGESKAKIRPHPNRVQQGTRATHVGALHRSGEDVTNPDASGMSQPHRKGCSFALDHFVYTLPAFVVSK